MRITINEVESVNDKIYKVVHGVDLEVEEKDLELTLEDFVERYIKPAFASLIAEHKASQ